MTGRYQTRFGHEFNERRRRPAATDSACRSTETTLADRLKALGLRDRARRQVAPRRRRRSSSPTARGFDEFYGTLANTPFFNPPNFVDTRKSPDVTPVKDDDFYTTDAYGERAVDWIGKQKDKPFFLYLPFNAQHAPLQAPKKYLDRFPNIEDEKRQTFAAMMSAHGRRRRQGAGEGPRDGPGGEHADLLPHRQRRPDAADDVEQRPAPRLQGDDAAKAASACRSACSGRARSRPARTYDHPIIQLDILPTALAAAGGKVDPAWKLDGVDLLPYLTGKNDGPAARDAVLAVRRAVGDPQGRLEARRQPHRRREQAAAVST